MTIKEERDAQKARWERYRRIAQKIYPYVTVRDQCAVYETADKDGAFMDVTIFVPSQMLEPTEPEPCLCGACVGDGNTLFAHKA